MLELATDEYRQKLMDRFLNKVHIQEDGCWHWVSVIDPKGYGRIKTTINGVRKMEGAHRVSFELFNEPIEEGLSVLHKCDNPKCVNPKHLFQGTHTDNMRDMGNKGRCRVPVQWGNNHTSKPVMAEGVIYPSYSAAGRALGVSDNAIRKRIKAKRKGYKVIAGVA
tara:strand:+ start:20 stop:514 length:495 start_codon:yes stop_codon:yes gene_type:complete